MASLQLKEYDDGQHRRPAIVADENASFVILGQDGTPLFLVNAFDLGGGKATCDISVPLTAQSKVMLFGWQRIVTSGADPEGRSWLAYGDLHDPEEPHPRPWSSPFAISNQGSDAPPA